MQNINNTNSAVVTPWQMCVCMYSFIKVSDKPQQPDVQNRKVKTTKS